MHLVSDVLEREMNDTTSAKAYYIVYLILVALTLLTCALSLMPQVGWHATLGLGIAAVKASLIALFFMHILNADRLPCVTIAAGILWFSILLGLTLSDYLTRALLSY
jgi:cytochrome c oxidase subunit 4